MRTCQIKIENNGTVNVSDAVDYVGEHCATELSIILNSELLSSSVSYYTLCFKPGAALKNPPQCKLTSDMIPNTQIVQNTLSYKLPAALTCFGSLDCQVIAHCIGEDKRVSQIIKSPIFRVFFEPSISGDDELFIEEANGFTSLIHTALAQLNLTIEEADELFDKINEAYENGELNGPVIMPHVSEDGILSWSNDAGLENPEPVNIKGPKGDKGDKGEDGKFSDEMANEIAENTAARHTHPNKELLDSLTESMIGTLDVYHELPETANDGDICIYSPANVPTVDDSGKLIYVDWDVFNKTFAQEDFTQLEIAFFDSEGTEVGNIYATSWDNSEGGYETLFEYTKGNELWMVGFNNGTLNKDNSYYDNGETTTYFTEAPTSFILPYFSRIENDFNNISGDVFYAPIKLMVYRDGWYEYTSTAVVDVNIGHGYELPESAKEGDLFLYAKPNTLTLADSGKKIYFDWEEFSKPISESAHFFAYLFQANETDGDTNFTISLNRTEYDCDCLIENNSTGFMLNVAFNGGTFGHAILGETEYNSIEEIPTYYQLPYFDEIRDYSLEGNAYLFHTEYELMKYQGGEWIAAVEAAVSDEQIASAVRDYINENPIEVPGVPTKTSQLENDSGFITQEVFDDQNTGFDQRITEATYLAEAALKVRKQSTATTVILEVYRYYDFGEVESLTLDLGVDAALEGYRNEYSFTFISGATPTVLTLPDTVKWANELTIEAKKRYEISIVDNIGLWCAVEVDV